MSDCIPIIVSVVLACLIVAQTILYLRWSKGMQSLTARLEEENRDARQKLRLFETVVTRRLGHDEHLSDRIANLRKFVEESMTNTIEDIDNLTIAVKHASKE